ncbi:MAG: histidinol-phosphatase HisJ family protein [Lentisphaerae bacterium]|nr:histidinol-phosphatase HisJ family protein [Lentisphaerota bacterium]
MNPRLPEDTHTHTYLCKHAGGEPREYVRRAEKLGLAGMVFTDHAPARDGYDPKNRMEEAEFQEYVRIVSAARDDSPLPVGMGIEADFYPGSTAFLTEWLPPRRLDVVLGSIHYIAGWGFDNPTEAHRWDGTDVEGAWRSYFTLVAQMAATRLYDVVGHLDLPKKFGHRPSDMAVCEMAAPALDAVAEAGMAVEINTSGLRRPVREMYPSPMLLRMAFERGIPVTFGSDAHMTEQVGMDFDKAVALARETGYTQYAVHRGRKRSMETIPG